MTTTTIDKMTVTITDSPAELGRLAAARFTEIITQAVTERGEAPIIFATGNSQLPFLKALRDLPNVPWSSVVAFHMDEYLGMSESHPASFSRFIHEMITDVFHPRVTYTMQGDAPDPQTEIARYELLLKAHPPVLCVMGIGENGHLAFNDPPADFNTAKTMHIVNLDEICRNQQVGEGHFPTIDSVPTQAFSLTVPALLRPPHVMVLAPESRKAQAVKAALEGPVTESCPASILRTQPHVELYLDRDSASLLTL